MRTIFFAVVALAAMAAFISCDNESNHLPDNNTPVAIRFSASVNQVLPQLRAAGASWTNGDPIGIFMVDNGTTAIAESAENKQYAATGSGSFTAVAGQRNLLPDGRIGSRFYRLLPVGKRHGIRLRNYAATHGRNV
ncbi:MAG: fimbrillin family protein [Dysgonamonadaceae bacterium]|nr:fimbrillin family protein [Dysgonamonadaceae bacterium]